jgi:PAS domain S-box-containing protein
MSPTADQELAELRRANAELLKERDVARAELKAQSAALAQRNTEYSERIEHQSATIDVLKAMSASPGDPQPVFELIVRHANKLCNGSGVGLFGFDGHLVHLRANLFGDAPAAQIANYRAMFPMVPNRGSISCRAILDKRIIHITDFQGDPEIHPTVKATGYQSQLSIPLMRDDTAIGVISLGGALGGFTDSQVALLQTFAEQAVIATSSAEMYRALQTRTADLQESLDYQTATSDVLKVISRSTFDLQRVFDTLVETAAHLCDADQALIARRQGELACLASNFGFPPEYEAYLKNRGAFLMDPCSPSVAYRAWCERQPVHVHDVTEVPGYPEAPIRLGKVRTSLGVPLLRDGETVGVMVLARHRVEPFTDRQIELVNTFADQAVIAIENTRLVTEQREALEQQTATADVLRVINASPGELAPVFDAMLDKALRLCGAAFGCLWTYDDEHVHAVALRGAPPAFAEFLTRAPHAVGSDNAHGRLLRGEQVVHIADVADDEAYRSGDPVRRALVALSGGRTLLALPLRKDGAFLGDFVIYRTEVRPFSEKQIAFLQNFANQAVVAMENARLLNEVRQRQNELRITFENMGDGVALYGETSHLLAWNRKFQEMFALPNALLEQRGAYEQHLRFLAARGDFGAQADVEEQIRHLTMTTDQLEVYERQRPDGRVLEIRRNPVPSGGFVLIFSDITERKRSEAEIRIARDAAEVAYRDLKAAQASLIQAEKMASLGQLTAGIAHEIKNPLNFVNNFASLSVDLLDELKQTAAPGLAFLDDARRAEINELTSTLADNLGKINEHGRRADGIVRGMLEHSRGSSGERRSVDLNALVEEALNLAYHGARAQDQNFNVTLQRKFAEGIAPVTMAPQDVTRVLLNLCSNGFYAARERQRMEAMSGFEPTLQVSTRDIGDTVEIRVRDNGTGILPEIRDRLFQPFFTTKPPGEGTGLGLSMSYEIITQQHDGSITVDSKVGEYSEFTIRLPRRT